IDPELRNDKSPFYKELESELMQKDINSQTIEDALNNYLFKVDEVANLHVVGLFYEEINRKVHIFARTQNAPYRFFYRYYDISTQCWSAWEIMQVDIPSYDAETTPTQPQSGTPPKPQSGGDPKNKLTLYRLVRNWGQD